MYWDSGKKAIDSLEDVTVYHDKNSLNMVEDENSQLRNEVGEKNELIEHWIRARPIVQISGTPQKPEGAFRKFLSSTLTGDDTVNDMKEMNKKLQRMLEETLSKNILLQRDLQTLLERTEL
uniref:Transposase n=1 Tax=Heterorhabditis bacteriophora TaxID=37862 RepID=A0A1I7XRD2_HETBA